jgi:hypothetical protein
VPCPRAGTERTSGPGIARGAQVQDGVLWPRSTQRGLRTHSGLARSVPPRAVFPPSAAAGGCHGPCSGRLGDSPRATQVTRVSQRDACSQVWLCSCSLHPLGATLGDKDSGFGAKDPVVPSSVPATGIAWFTVCWHSLLRVGGSWAPVFRSLQSWIREQPSLLSVHPHA